MKKFIEKSYRDFYRQRLCNQHCHITDCVISFTEGMDFKNKLVEDGYQLVVNKQNDVSSLSAEQIKDIFDGEITNWNEIEDVIRNYSFPFKRHKQLFYRRGIGSRIGICSRKISELIAQHPEMIGFIPQQYIDDAFKGKVLEAGKIGFSDIF